MMNKRFETLRSKDKTIYLECRHALPTRKLALAHHLGSDYSARPSWALTSKLLDDALLNVIVGASLKLAGLVKARGVCFVHCQDAPGLLRIQNSRKS